ncbi:hypothetical protein K439DRAFT_102511 [Ramaria rubella]|nr:hypothetical protein K439DRAFT_102511 [Ramaria rubella]
MAAIPPSSSKTSSQLQFPLAMVAALTGAVLIAIFSLFFCYRLCHACSVAFRTPKVYKFALSPTIITLQFCCDSEANITGHSDGYILRVGTEYFDVPAVGQCVVKSAKFAQ